MLRLNRIALTQFKNYQLADFHFESSVMAISGANGTGKTNLLDAIYYLSFTKSYFGLTDSLQVQTGSNGFRLDGHFSINHQPHHIHVILRETGKKEIANNNISYEKFSEHIGRFPIVMIAPDEIELINGSPEVRRRFIDTILCQIDAHYLQTLIQYNKILQQRNGYLKQAALHRRRDDALLDILDEQLIAAGLIIFEKRNLFAPILKTQILSYYKAVAGKTEPVDFKYESQLLQESFDVLLSNNREKDYLLQRTNTGIHKDNPEILLEDAPFKSRGSQGQKKSMLFAMKLAEASIIEENKGFSPILLLDDVFEKLDANRMDNLLSHICFNMKAQIFLTDTHAERMTEIFKKMGQDIQHIPIKHP